MTKKTEINWLRHFDIEAYLDDYLGIFRTALGANGDEHICEECPFCGKFAKLYVNAETGLWLCYRCGESGSFPMLMMEVEGISWREARKKLTAAAGDHLSRSIKDMRELREKKRARRAKRAKKAQSVANLPDEYLPVWDEDKQIWRRIGYLDIRGIKLRTAKLFRLGICLSGDYAGRVIFPVVEHGEIKSFQARATGSWEPKYMNPDEVEKGNFIYGHDIVAGQDPAIVVEGPTDVIGCYQKGVPACALLGKTTTAAQIAKLRDLGAQRIILMLDGNAGDDALKTYLFISEIMPVDIARLPGDLDPDEAPKDVLEKALREASPPSSRELRRIRHA